MKPSPRPKISEFDLFNARFEQLLQYEHALYILANNVDWSCFTLAMEDGHYANNRDLANGIRSLVGPHCLKHIINQTHKSGLERWTKNFY